MAQQQDEKEKTEEMEEECSSEDEWDEIEKLTTVGITATDVAKLATAGLYTIQGLQMCPMRELLNIRGISENKVLKLLDAASKIVGPSVKFVTGNEAMQRRKERTYHITTGSKELDTLLGGGVESGTITEVHGEYRTGKTQLALSLCVTAQLPREAGGGNGKVLFLDTAGTWRGERIGQIAARFGLPPDDVLDNIVVVTPLTTTDQLHAAVQQAAGQFVKGQYALIIVDSLMGLYRTEYSGRGQLADRQQTIGKLVARLLKLAFEFNVAVYVTNQVMATPEGGIMMGDPKKPIGGNIVGHMATHRICLRKSRGENRSAKLIDSPSLAEGDALFAITTEGITDAQD